MNSIPLTELSRNTRMKLNRHTHVARLIMMMSSNGNIFRVTGHLCGEFTGHRWIPRTKAMTRSFDVFFDLRLNKRLSKHSRGWWFETTSCSLWRHCNDAVHSKSDSPPMNSIPLSELPRNTVMKLDRHTSIKTDQGWVVHTVQWQQPWPLPLTNKWDSFIEKLVEPL